MKLSTKEIETIKRCFVDYELFSIEKLYSYYNLCNWLLEGKVNEHFLIASQIELYLKERLTQPHLEIVRYKFGLVDGKNHSDVEIVNNFNISEEKIYEVLRSAFITLVNPLRLSQIDLLFRERRINVEIEYYKKEIQKKNKELIEIQRAKQGIPNDKTLFNDLIKKLKFSNKAVNALKINSIASIHQFLSLTENDLKQMRGLGNKTTQELLMKQSEIIELFK